MTAKDCFDILRISRNATLDEAKESYKRLVKLWHPDQYGSSPEKQELAHEKLKEINVAYRDAVSILKYNPAEAETSSDEEASQRPHEKTPRHETKGGRALWRRVANFFNANIQKTKESGEPDKASSLSSVSTRHRRGAFADWEGGIAPDFRQILKTAVRERRLTGGSPRQRHGSRKRIRRASGNEISYRVDTTKKRSTGIRVEKITPVSRVGRIGGD